MKITTKQNKALTKKENKMLGRARFKTWPEDEIRDYKKYYEPDTIWFFMKEGDKLLSFGGLRPIKIKYLDKTYNVKGICSIIAIEKGKGYGKMIIQAIINHLNKTGKTGLGFCGRKNTKFYKKAGLNTKKEFGRRFALKNPKTGEIAFETEGDVGDGLYYEGKDKFISKVLKTKSIGYYWIPNLKEPHW